MYPTPCCIELPTFFVFTSRCGTSNFRFRGFFLYFRRLFLLNGSFFFRFAYFGTFNFRFSLNFRFRLAKFRKLSRRRILMYDQDWRIRLSRCSLDKRPWLSSGRYRRWNNFSRFVGRARPCSLRRWIGRYIEPDRLLIWLTADRLRRLIYFFA